MKTTFLAVAASMILIYSCGYEKSEIVERPVYPPGCDIDGCEPVEPGPGPDPIQISYQEMQGHLNTYCAGCHPNDDFMDSERALRQSSTFDRIFNRSMPPQNASKQLPETIRTKMLNFFR